ncbi:MAG: HesA/MoeB/ThiF family protein [Candidatus Bathyarchaeia archaeon]|nr:HesA/MoeB/ThiF family protein [Candidatus Bathyarchaeota archaeon]
MSKSRRGIDLSESEIEYYSRQIVLPDIGYKGQVKLKGASVCIVGLGGLGSPAALQLAAMGVGHLRLVDHDVVELSNLQRQHIYSVKFLGYPKVEAAAIRLKELNPNIEVEPLPISLNQSTIEEAIKDVDVVIDGLDRMSTRYIVNRACQKLDVPYIYGAAIMTFGSASTIIPGETPCLECFQGGIDDDMLPSCAVVGVHPAILNIIASIEVSETTKIITGKKPQLAGKLLHCNISDMVFEIIDVSRAEKCPVCGSKGTPSKPIEEKVIMELCGREGKRVFLIVPRRNLNIDMNKLSWIVSSSKDFEVKVRANLGITFVDNVNNRAISILKSGIMIIDNVNNEGEALGFYRKIMIDELGIDASSIEP